MIKKGINYSNLNQTLRGSNERCQVWYYQKTVSYSNADRSARHRTLSGLKTKKT